MKIKKDRAEKGKKYGYLIWGMLAVVFSIYTLYAWHMVNGINIYFLTYEIGMLLVYTYVPAGILALIFWIVFMKLVKKAWKDRKKSVSAQETVESALPETVAVEAVSADIKEDMKEQYTEKKDNRLCSNCGEKLEKDAKFCTKCGTKAE